MLELPFLIDVFGLNSLIYCSVMLPVVLAWSVVRRFVDLWHKLHYREQSLVCSPSVIMASGAPLLKPCSTL